jgi:hypothetical protein
MSKCAIDLQADLLPGVSAAGIPLGISVEEVDDIESFEKQITGNNEFPATWGRKYTSENVVIWADSDKRIFQVMVCRQYQGKFRKHIGVGSDLEIVMKELGLGSDYDPYLFHFVDQREELIAGIGINVETYDTHGGPLIIGEIYIFPLDSV